MRRLRRILLFSVGSASVAIAQPHLDLRREAWAAYDRKEYKLAHEKFAAALALRPDSPAYLHRLAAVSALLGNSDAAIRYLQRLARLGVTAAVERDPDFASLQGTPDFIRVLRDLAENRSPQGESDLFAELPGRTGILEGIAYRERTGELYLGDVHHRCIWKRDRDGRITRFSVEDEELLGIFGIAVDERRNTLWAAMAAVPEMSGYTPQQKGQGALAEFSLATSELLRVIPVPADGLDHGLGDVLIAEDGTVYATDSLAPIVWRYTPGDEEMVKLAESPHFVSLQGMVFADRALIVADYGNGLFAIELVIGAEGPVRPEAIRALRGPPDTTLVGIDGLLAVPSGIVAVQNGVTPERILYLSLAPDQQSIAQLTILAAAHPHLSDLTLLTTINGRPAFLAGAGWSGFDPAQAKTPAPHTVRVMQVTVP